MLAQAMFQFLLLVWISARIPSVLATTSTTSTTTLACTDISGTYDASGVLATTLTQNGCSGSSCSWSYTVSGSTATILGTGVTGQISGSTGSYTIQWSNDITYTQTCTDISGTYTYDASGVLATLTQNGCSGSSGSWSYTVSGSTATILGQGVTGQISESAGSYTIQWSNDITYTQTCTDISGTYNASDVFETLTQNGCSGSSGSWCYTVSGSTATILGQGVTGQISGSTGSYTIQWSNDITYYTQPPATGFVELTGTQNYVLCGCATCTSQTQDNECRTCQDGQTGYVCRNSPSWSSLYVGNDAASDQSETKQTCFDDPTCLAVCHADHENKNSSCFLTQLADETRRVHYCNGYSHYKWRCWKKLYESGSESGSVSGDPVCAYGNKRVEFHLPVGVPSLLFQGLHMKVYGSTFNGLFGDQWIKRIIVNSASDQKVIDVSIKDDLVHFNKNSVVHGEFETLKIAIWSPDRFDLNILPPYNGYWHLEDLTVTVFRQQRGNISRHLTGAPRRECASIASAMSKLFVCSSSAHEFFGTGYGAWEFAHLDIDLVDVHTESSASLKGVLPELWGLMPVSERVRSFIVKEWTVESSGNRAVGYGSVDLHPTTSSYVQSAQDV